MGISLSKQFSLFPFSSSASYQSHQSQSQIQSQRPVPVPVAARATQTLSPKQARTGPIPSSAVTAVSVSECHGDIGNNGGVPGSRRSPGRSSDPTNTKNPRTRRGAAAGASDQGRVGASRYINSCYNHHKEQVRPHHPGTTSSKSSSPRSAPLCSSWLGRDRSASAPGPAPDTGTLRSTSIRRATSWSSAPVTVKYHSPERIHPPHPKAQSSPHVVQLANTNTTTSTTSTGKAEAQLQTQAAESLTDGDLGGSGIGGSQEFHEYKEYEADPEEKTERQPFEEQIKRQQLETQQPRHQYEYHHPGRHGYHYRRRAASRVPKHITIAASPEAESLAEPLLLRTPPLDYGTTNHQHEPPSTVAAAMPQTRGEDHGSSLSYAVLSAELSSIERAAFDLLDTAGVKPPIRLVIGIDFSNSNRSQGRTTFNGKCLHDIDATGRTLNPYQAVIAVIGKALAPFEAASAISVFGFGDNTTFGSSCFPFHDDHRPMRSVEEVLSRYATITPTINLAGPTSFAPVIWRTMALAEERDEYHVLLIIADGQISSSIDETRKAIVRASEFPISIVMVGVGDGPWNQMREFDAGLKLEHRKFDNFQFVDYNQIIDTYRHGARGGHDDLAKGTPTNEAATSSGSRSPSSRLSGHTAFVLEALKDVPKQYSSIRALQLLQPSTLQPQFNKEYEQPQQHRPPHKLQGTVKHSPEASSIRRVNLPSTPVPFTAPARVAFNRSIPTRAGTIDEKLFQAPNFDQSSVTKGGPLIGDSHSHSRNGHSSNNCQTVCSQLMSAHNRPRSKPKPVSSVSPFNKASSKPLVNASRSTCGGAGLPALGHGSDDLNCRCLVSSGTYTDSAVSDSAREETARRSQENLKATPRDSNSKPSSLESVAAASLLTPEQTSIPTQPQLGSERRRPGTKEAGALTSVPSEVPDVILDAS